MKSLMSCAAALFTLAAISFSPTQAADVLKSGTFVGVDKHASSGPVEIVKDGETVKVVLTSDFMLKDAPVPRLAWGRDGYKAGTIFGNLNTFEGEQEYVIPAGTDIA